MFSYKTPEKNVDLLNVFLVTTKLILTHPLFSAGLIRDLMGVVLQWHGGGPLNGALLCHFVIPPADYFIDSRLQYRDQHNASVSVQGQFPDMHHPIKYSCSKGEYGLSSKLIVPPGESLH